MIKKIIKRILKSTIMTYTLFILGSLIFVFLLSLLVWASFNASDVFCGGYPRIANKCPPWYSEYSLPYIPFETVFMMVSVMYLVCICVMFIGVLLINREKIKELEYLRKQKKR